MNSGTATFHRGHTSGFPSTAIADQGSFRKPGERELANSKVATSEAGPVLLKWNKPFEAGCSVDWDAEATKEA